MWFVRAWTVAAVVLVSLALPGSAGAQTWAGAQVAVSPDGAHVYATGLRTLSFARDRATGALAPISDLEAGGE